MSYLPSCSEGILISLWQRVCVKYKSKLCTDRHLWTEKTHRHKCVASGTVYDLLLTFGIVCTVILSKGENAAFAGILHLVLTWMCMCAHMDEVLLPKSRGKMTGMRRRGGCSSINQRMEGKRKEIWDRKRGCYRWREGEGLWLVGRGQKREEVEEYRKDWFRKREMRGGWGSDCK